MRSDRDIIKQTGQGLVKRHPVLTKAIVGGAVGIVAIWLILSHIWFVIALAAGAAVATWVIKRLFGSKNGQ
jgi:hypothetical protein